MPQLGPMEIVVIAALALIVFGPERLPEIARNIGKAVREVRRMASDVKDEFDFSFDDDTPVEDTPVEEPDDSPPETHAHPQAPPLARPPDEDTEPTPANDGDGPEDRS